MHLDLDRAAPETSFQSRFCIIGAGVAGLLLAHRLARSGATVTLLEAGGLELEERSQALYTAAELTGEPHTGSHHGRFRTLGGSSTRWGGQLLPYTPDVFSPPPGSLAPAWPITAADLEPSYPEIERLMHVGTLPFDEQLLPAMGQARPAFSPALRVRFSKWAPFGRRNLAPTLGAEALAHPAITVITHANVAELLGDGGRIASARALNYAGQSFSVIADHFIVAAGTVESARLLLLSPAAVPDPHDQIGRFFHDHLSARVATVAPSARRALIRRLGPFFTRNVLHTVKLEATPELQQRHGLLAAMGHFVIAEPEGGGIAALRSLLTAAQRRSRVSGAMLAQMVRGAGDVLRLAWSTRVRKRRAVSPRAEVFIHIDLEQPPRAESRVSLTATRDPLGLRKASVAWRIGREEEETVRRFAAVMDRELAGAGLGPIAWSADLRPGHPIPMVGTFHAMGGLRMGSDPRTSVVDSGLTVHGVANLHIASCAVFPSGGSSNPTFTLMALALRLADRLAS